METRRLHCIFEEDFSDKANSCNFITLKSLSPPLDVTFLLGSTRGRIFLLWKGKSRAAKHHPSYTRFGGPRGCDGPHTNICTYTQTHDHTLTYFVYLPFYSRHSSQQTLVFFERLAFRWILFPCSWTNYLFPWRCSLEWKKLSKF